MKKITIIIVFLVFGNCSKSIVTKPVTIRVATYNTHFFKSGFAGIENTIKKMNCHIVAMQEVLVQDNKNYAARIAGRLGYYHYSTRHYIKHGKRFWVLSFLSKYRIRKTAVIKLGHHRLALRMYVKVKNREICFVTIHLSPYIWSEKNIISLNRTRLKVRAGELKDLVNWLGNETRPVILLGDFNELAGSSTLKILVRNGFTDADSGPFKTKLGTFPIKKRLVNRLKAKYPDFLVPEIITLDYIFYRGNVILRKINAFKSNASDHYPLVAEFEV